MIERVSSTLFEALPRGSFHLLSPHEVARLIISAMREPTETMVAAGTAPDFAAPYPCADREFRNDNVGGTFVGSWQLMIDAALQDC
jgi:hypothetical protein